MTILPPDKKKNKMVMEKVKFELEFLMNTSRKILFNFISTPSGLSGWFADDVHIRGDVFTFIWEGSEEKAKLLTKKKDESVKFRWVANEPDDKSYFELRLHNDPLTRQLILFITDFAEEDEIEDAKMLWESQVEDLKHKLGI